MGFEYDLDKSVENKRKHGIDFDEAQALWADPALVRLRFTAHWPLLSWALADLTAVPVSWAGASTYRPLPSAAVPGRSTVAPLLSVVDGVDR